MTIATDPRKTGVASAASVLAANAVAVSGAADTVENTLATISIPGGSMGPNGQLRVTAIFTVTNSANAKTLRLKLAGTTMSSVQVTTIATQLSFALIANRNATNSQVANNAFNMRADSSGAVVTAAIDTSATQSLTITGQKALAGETLTLESYTVEVIYGN